MEESLNISKINYRGKLGLKSLNWVPMPCDTGLRVFSYTPSSMSFLYIVKIEFATTFIAIQIRGKMKSKNRVLHLMKELALSYDQV